MPEGSGKHQIRVRRMNAHHRDVLRLGQAHVLPGLAAIYRQAFLTLGRALIGFNHLLHADVVRTARLGGIHGCMQHDRHAHHDRDLGLLRRFTAVVAVRPGVALEQGHRVTHRPLPSRDVETRQLIAAKQLGCPVNRLSYG